MSKAEHTSAEIDFSLASGGPFFNFLTRVGLHRPPMELLRRRMLAAILITWLPPLLFSIAAGSAFGGVRVPFAYDLATQVRFLISLPLLFFAESLVHKRISPAVKQFIERGIVPPELVPRFESLLASVMRWRNSTAVEAGLFATVLFCTHHFSRGMALKTSTWYADFSDQGVRMTAAGFWFSWISMPLFQFVLLRWFYRWGLWTMLLVRMGRLPLRLIPTHPDRAAGLSFLSRATTGLWPVLVALSSIVSGVIAGKVHYEGASLASFKFDIAATVGFLLLLSLGPLCAFIPALWGAKLKGELEYGSLSTRYVAAFDVKWNPKDHRPREDFLGSADIQSLADLANSYSVVERMRMVPFGQEAVLQTAASALLPLAPLVLFVIPLDQLLVKLLGILF